MEKIIEITKGIKGWDTLDLEEIEEKIKEILDMEYSSSRPVYVSLLLTDNDGIQEVNKKYRGKDAPTDVISFAYHDNDMDLFGPYDSLGDIIISLEKVDEQSKEYNHSFNRELHYMLVHGVLHLLGYDHIDEEDKKKMREKEEEILGKFDIKRD